MTDQQRIDHLADRLLRVVTEMDGRRAPDGRLEPEALDREDAAIVAELFLALYDAAQELPPRRPAPKPPLEWTGGES